MVPVITTSVLSGQEDGPENGLTEDCPASAFENASETYCCRGEKPALGHLSRSNRSSGVNRVSSLPSVNSPEPRVGCLGVWALSKGEQGIGCSGMGGVIAQRQCKYLSKQAETMVGSPELGNLQVISGLVFV